MNPLDELREVVADGRRVRAVEDGIYSVLPEGAPEHAYDRRAAVYDAVVGTRLYNRVMWGASPLDYAAFARRAVASHASDWMLDAPCGSMLFSARAYLESRRPIVALDQSLRMLRRARSRLVELAGSFPAHVLLLQADLSDLPFRPGSFHTVLCMNVLHLYADAGALIPRLDGLLADGGRLFLTSLVANDRLIGDGYLRILHRAGEFVRPRSSAELEKLLRDTLPRGVSYRTRGNMAFATAPL
jgi:SAM-dependent methyltransferase